MLDGVCAFFGGSLPEEAIAIGWLARRDRNASMTGPRHESGADALAFAVTPGILRLAVAGAIAANVLLPSILMWRVAIVGDSASVRHAALATAAMIVLHLRHVAFGLRNEQPPAGAWTLAALAIVNVAATVLVGRLWAVQFAALAVSVLIVVRGPS